MVRSSDVAKRRRLGLRRVFVGLWRAAAPIGLGVVLVGTFGLALAADDWPDDWSEELDLVSQIEGVNEGELEFLPTASAAGAHFHQNRIAITPASLEQGWVELVQCHDNIDPVPAAQILFRDGGIRELEIASARNIGRAWVDGHSVQLEDVGRDAQLCIRAQSQALMMLGDGLYRLRNGPYMRRFLDGYYPMRVSLNIAYPGERLQLIAQSPVTQEGFDVASEQDRLAVDATFEGRLMTCFDFCERGRGECPQTTPACGAETRP